MNADFVHGLLPVTFSIAPPLHRHPPLPHSSSSVEVACFAFVTSIMLHFFLGALFHSLGPFGSAFHGAAVLSLHCSFVTKNK
jgi:hypothetical protein